jgi:hypothetical protein
VSDLNQYLIATDSLANQETDMQTAYTWNSQTLANVFSGRSIQDASITNAKITNVSWQKAQGGTATLGGTANGDGLLVVNNSAGVEISRVDNTGFSVKQNGTTVIFMGVS